MFLLDELFLVTLLFFLTVFVFFLTVGFFFLTTALLAGVVFLIGLLGSELIILSNLVFELNLDEPFVFISYFYTALVGLSLGVIVT